MTQLTDTQRQAINAEIFGSRKIEAIKLYREATGCQLIDAKQGVEEMEKYLRQQQPEKFAHKAKSGCMSVIACCALLVSAAAVAIYILRS